MAIQNRRGEYVNMDPNKIAAGEWAVVLSGDPESENGRGVYLGFGNGNIERMLTKTDMEEYLAVTADYAQQAANSAAEAFSGTPTGYDDLVADVGAHEVDITSLQSEIGSTPMGTDATTVTGAIAEIGGKATIQKITSGSHDLNNYTTEGKYFFSGVTLSNQPNNAVNGWLEVLTTDTANVKQIWHRYGSNPTTYKDEYIRLYASNTWSSWERIATQTDVNTAITTVTRKTVNGEMFFTKFSNGIVNFVCEIQQFAGGLDVNLLPSGFLPARNYYGVGMDSNNNVVPYALKTNGNIKSYGGSTNGLWFTAVYSTV